MIMNIKKAQNIASEWYGGQWTALYSLTSTGKYFPEHRDGYLKEIQENLLHLDHDPGITGISPQQKETEYPRLTALKEFLENYEKPYNGYDFTYGHLDEFIINYLICALWSSNDESNEETGGDPLDDNYTIDDIAEDSLVRVQEVCSQFLRRTFHLIGPEKLEQAGHDFWLTRNGHGAGFWDRDDFWDNNSKELTIISKKFGSASFYVGDDGKLHLEDEYKEK